MTGLAERYTALRDLLAPWSELWGHSVFHRFAEMERLIAEDWFAYGASAELSRQFAIGQGERDPDAPAAFLDWIRLIRALCALPRAAGPRALCPSLSRGLTPKKKHEIEAILGLFREAGISPARVLDIGGGVGHLARHLALGLGCHVDSIDRDRTLQEKGREILGAHPWREHLKAAVSFVPGEFPAAALAIPATEGAWAVGLHTCGALAWAQLELAEQGYSVLNFGCCYEKLNPATDTQRSRFVRARPLPLTDEALFLGNRGGVERSLDGFIFQQRVLRYRFTLHELLIREGCKGPPFEAAGTASEEAYNGPFALYARERLKSVEGAPAALLALSDAAFEDFCRSVAPLVERQRFVTFLRNLLARPVEIALLLDRALFVEEARNTRLRQVGLVELFEPRLSPRNIGLIAEVRT